MPIRHHAQCLIGLHHELSNAVNRNGRFVADMPLPLSGQIRDQARPLPDSLGRGLRVRDTTSKANRCPQSEFYSLGTHDGKNLKEQSEGQEGAGGGRDLSGRCADHTLGGHGARHGARRKPLWLPTMPSPEPLLGLGGRLGQPEPWTCSPSRLIGTTHPGRPHCCGPFFRRKKLD